MNNKFSHLPTPIANSYRDWEANAIEYCKNDPKTAKWIAEQNLCVVCLIRLPICHCVDRCRRCGLAFGQYACQCPGPFTSAFDRKTGELLPPLPRTRIVVDSSTWTGRFLNLYKIIKFS